VKGLRVPTLEPDHFASSRNALRYRFVTFFAASSFLSKSGS
jgi:hypothetical protein